MPPRRSGRPRQQLHRRSHPLRSPLQIPRFSPVEVKGEGEGREGDPWCCCESCFQWTQHPPQPKRHQLEPPSPSPPPLGGGSPDWTQQQVATFWKNVWISFESLWSLWSRISLFFLSFFSLSSGSPSESTPCFLNKNKIEPLLKDSAPRQPFCSCRYLDLNWK